MKNALDEQGARDRLHSRAGRHSRPPIVRYRILLPLYLPLHRYLHRYRFRHIILFLFVPRAFPSQVQSLFHVGVHDSGIDQKQDTDEKSKKMFYQCEESHEVVKSQEMCIGEVTVEDMMHRQFCDKVKVVGTAE